MNIDPESYQRRNRRWKLRSSLICLAAVLLVGGCRSSRQPPDGTPIQRETRVWMLGDPGSAKFVSVVSPTRGAIFWKRWKARKKGWTQVRKLIDPESFLSHMRLAAEQVGVVALKFRGKVANVGKKIEGDDDPVHRAAAEALSDVDLVSQEVILLSLAAHFPFVRLDAEEDTPLVERFAENDSRYTVVLDPIDGTLNYLSQRGEFGVLIGLLEDDRFIASLCHFPLRKETFVAVRDRGAFRYDLSSRSSTASRERVISQPGGRVVFINSGTSRDIADRLKAAGYEPARSGCSAVDATVAATGLAAAAISMRPPSIRRCVGTLISREAGGVLTLATGEPYDCTHPRGLSSQVVSASAAVSAAVLAVLAQRED